MSRQGAYIFGCAGLTLSEGERRFFEKTQPWGFILFARNVDSPDQLRALTADLRGAVGRNAPIFIDQEGGRVARMIAPHWREWLPALDQAQFNKRNATRAMYLRYRLIADELYSVGIDGNCAPVVDLAFADTHPVLRNRCLGEDVVHVVERAQAVAQGLLEGGVLPVVKHLPGHGRATMDSHLDLPHVATHARELHNTDFLALSGVSNLPLGMTAHIVFEDIDPTAPATQSPIMLDLIRKDIGFDGLLMTDDLSMQALEGPLSLRARRALAAGCDLILHCNGDREEMAEIVDATGQMSEGAQARADKALIWRAVPMAVDIEALEAEFQNLMTGETAENPR